MAARVETPGEAEGSAAAGSPPASGAPHAFLPALAYSFRHYADGYGRPGKFEYWALSGPYLANGLLAILSTHVFSSLILLFLLIYLAALLPATVLQARRLHDVGMSGWFALSSLIPGIGLIPIIAIGLIPGDDGPNKYGPPPTAG